MERGHFQCRSNRKNSRMAEYIQVLETYVATRKLNPGNGESILSLLYEAYSDVNRSLRKNRMEMDICHEQNS